MFGERISMLAKMASEYKSIVDVGCDHAYVLIELVKKYHINKGYALDVNEGPLENAKLSIKKYGCDDKITTHLSDGLNDFDENFDLAIVSGMGGKLIVKILESAKKKLINKSLLIEAHSDRFLVRKWLFLNGYKIVEEVPLFTNGKYYEIIKAEYGIEKYNYFELLFGPKLLLNKPSLFINHHKRMLDIYKEALVKKKGNNYDLKEEVLAIEYAIGDRLLERYYYARQNYTTLMDVNSETLIVVLPGGGYKMTPWRDSLNVGLRLNAYGYSALVFNYREDNLSYDFDLVKEVAQAIPKKYKYRKIYLLGFSAGGHLALELGLHQDIYDLDVNGLILGYPLVSFDENITYKPAIKNFLNDNKELIKRFSEENEVKTNAPKIFLFTSSIDNLVSVENSLRLLFSYQEKSLPFEAHIFPMGHHALSLCDEAASRTKGDVIPYVGRWFEMMIEWLKNDEK